MSSHQASSLADVLAAHGLSVGLADHLTQVAAALHRRTLRSGGEFAAFIDAESGRPLPTVAGGTNREVDVSGILAEMEPGRTYVGFHTHPSSTSFSQADVAVLVLNPAIRTIVVQGVDGTWYIMSKEAARVFDSDAVRQLVESYQVALSRVALDYLERIASGEINRQSATREATHDVWTQLAPRFGLLYDRLEP